MFGVGVWGVGWWRELSLGRLPKGVIGAQLCICVNGFVVLLLNEKNSIKLGLGCLLVCLSGIRVK